MFDNLDGFDDIFVKIEGLKGTSGGNIKVQFKTNPTSNNYNFGYNYANFLASSARTYYGGFERALYNYWKVSIHSNYTFYIKDNYSSNYRSKINKLRVATDSPNKITEATISIYGRNRM